jgi:hypothetical protein
VIARRQGRLGENLAGQEIGLVPIGEPDPIPSRLHLGDRCQSELQIQVRRIRQPLTRAQVKGLGVLTALT